MTQSRRCCLASGMPPFHHSIDCTLRGRKPVPASKAAAPEAKALQVPPAQCPESTPRWFTGHWREWHRGHGCSQDDGKPRANVAISEIAQHAANKDTGYLTDAELGFLRASTTSGNELLVRALDELKDRRNVEKQRVAATFDHSDRSTKYFEPLLGYCVCAHCTKLSAFEVPPKEPAR